MTEPIYDDSTERLYARGLPLHHRTEDENLNWTFKSWLSGIGGQLNLADAIIERFGYVPPEDGEGYRTSDLVNPSTADAAWLPWLAQLLGIRLSVSINANAQRLQIQQADFHRGTKEAMAFAAQNALTGEKHVSIFDHSNAGGVGAGNQWEVLVVTIASETTGDPLAEIISAGVKPAGVQLFHSTFSSSWSDVASAYPTWTDWNASSWQQIAEAGL